MLKDFVTTIQTHVNLMCSVKMLLLFIPYETFPAYIYHFTGNRDESADYKALNYKLYAKTVNSKAEIVSVGTMVL